MAQTAAPGGPVELRVLGEVEVVGPDGVIEVRPGLPRVLLDLLAVRRNDVVPADVLIDQLWSRSVPSNPANALQVQVSYLRRQLRPLGGAIRIERDGSGYRLVIDPDGIDAVRFDAVLERHAEVLDGDPVRNEVQAALTALDEALGWWRGEAYAEAAHLAPVEPEHHRLGQRRILAEARRAELLDRLGRHDEAVATLEPLAARHPLHEDLWAALMGALYRAGRQGDSLRAFSTARGHLVEELGIEPGPRLRDLERAVLENDPRLDHVELAAGATGAAASEVERVRMPAATALALPAEPRGRLPAPITELVGRGWELEQVTALVASHRLVTLTGVGGVGKTRLAFEVARRASTETRVVELGGITTGATFPSVLAAAIPVPTDPDIDPVEVVASRIGDDEWLLVLDTCEHLVDAVGRVSARLLASCPSLRILATSRQPLHVAGELTWPVPLLEVPDATSRHASEVGAAPAVRLFVERARATDPSFTIDDDNAAAVASICAELDGLPLAIELAAARVGVMSPESIRARLSNRFSLLTHGPRDAAARQRSLHATVEWSVEQLDPTDLEVFESLGVFRGTFDLSAVAAVTDLDDLTTLDAVSALVDRSLLVADGHDRFRQLDTLRAFSTDRLGRDPGGGGRLAVLRERHARWVLAVAIECDPYSHGPLPAGWPRLRAEALNIRAALEWAFSDEGDGVVGARIAGAVAGSLVLAGDFAEATQWLTRAQAVELDDETAATVLRGVAVTNLYQGRYAEAFDASGRSHDHAVASGIAPLIASCGIAHGSAAWGVGDLARSRSLLTDAAASFDALGDVRGRGFALARLARTLNALDDPGAVGTAAAAVDDLEAADEDWVRVVALDHLAQVLLTTGDVRAAAVRAEEAVGLADRIGSASGRLSALGLLGRIRCAGGDAEEARRIQVAVIESALRLRNPGAVLDGLSGLADALCAAGRADTAALVLGSLDARLRRGDGLVDRRRIARHHAQLDALRPLLDADRVESERRSGSLMTPSEVLDAVGGQVQAEP